MWEQVEITVERLPFRQPSHGFPWSHLCRTLFSFAVRIVFFSLVCFVFHSFKTEFSFVIYYLNYDFWFTYNQQVSLWAMA